MTFLRHVERRLNRAAHILGLSQEANWALRVLVLLDIDAAAAERARDADVHGRIGVYSWSALAEQRPREIGDVENLERAVVSLGNWGLLQIVGQSPGDPVVPGASALRLTYAGRACIGLAPAVRSDPTPIPDEPGPWQILHSSSRESLMLRAEELVGPMALRPTPVRGRTQDVSRFCGQMAESLCNRGGIVMDAYGLDETSGSNELQEVLWRTRSARGRRVLLIHEPTPIRTLTLSIGGQLTWVEPVSDVRRGSMVLDKRITSSLQELHAESTADACGVPDSSLAIPRRVETRWEELLVPEDVYRQLQQVLMHVKFRMETLPGRSNFVRRGGGYRLLLSGLPGTGKSMAAEALATTLDRPLVKLDLSSVLSKWLGETEKQLGEVFDVAESSGAVLVLDEAEALFRQRDSSPSSSGGLATGVAYLLTRLERFEGVLVATTNRTRDLDEAFFRRFDDFVVMPVPDRKTRALLWERMLSTDPNRGEIDYALLGRHFPISGGLVRGAAIRAQAWADGLKRPLDTAVVLASLARELEKSDRSSSEVMIEPYKSDVESLLKGHVEEIRAVNVRGDARQSR